jgi:hypothetical protein
VIEACRGLGLQVQSEHRVQFGSAKHVAKAKWSQTVTTVAGEPTLNAMLIEAGNAYNSIHEPLSA